MQFVANYVLTQFGWFTSVFGGANQMPWLGPLTVVVVVGLHLWLARRPEREFMLILCCGIIGATFDSLLVYFGWVSYPSGMFATGLAPYWIITMWMLFGTTLNLSMGWLKGRPCWRSRLGRLVGRCRTLPARSSAASSLSTTRRR